MRILIIGSNGQLGWELVRQCGLCGITPLGCDLPETDITDPAQAQGVVYGAEANLVVNAAAYTAVDRAESESDLAFAANRDGPLYLARACAAREIPLIHLSTDYVFDGTATHPYREEAPVAPLGVYGHSKAAGEDAVRGHWKRHLILRTSWLYGVHGHNFVRTMLRLGCRQPVIRVVADQQGCPTSAADLAGTILSLAERLSLEPDAPWGTYHFCGKGSTTWHGFARQIFEYAQGLAPLKVNRVEPITTAEFAAPAPRPLYSVLSCERIRRRFGVAQKPWQESLKETLQRILDKDAREGLLYDP